MVQKNIKKIEKRFGYVGMIDEGFGLELWAEDEKTLKKREKALSDFRAKLLSPQGENRIKQNKTERKLKEENDAKSRN